LCFCREVIHSQNASAPLSEDSPFSWDSGILFIESGVKSLMPKNTERLSSRDQLIAALEN
jgi:hypothetical protein